MRQDVPSLPACLASSVLPQATLFASRLHHTLSALGGELVTHHSSSRPSTGPGTDQSQFNYIKS